MSNYTKGPWAQGHDGGYNPNTVFGGNGEAVAQCYGIPLHCKLEQLADEGRWNEGLSNARLIAAAPELLEALKWCENHLRMIEEEDFPNIAPDSRMFNSRRNALAVISKAEGK